jgi:cytidyltransferase-like protein
VREKSARWRRNNPERWRAVKKKNSDLGYRRWRQWFDKLRVAPCLDCGGIYSPEAMDFHHVRGPKRFNVANMYNRKKELVLAEIAKCDLICSNCHRTRTKTGYAPQTVLTVGTFDILHPGHLSLFDAGAALGRLIVGVNPDAFVLSYKGHAPVLSTLERMMMVGACRRVTRVEVNDGQADMRVIVERVTPQIILVGADWRDRDYMRQTMMTSEWLEERKIKLMYHELLPAMSSSLLKEEIRER